MNPNLPDIYADHKPCLHLGLCQVQTEAWDLEGNIRRTLEALDGAADQGAHLAITPECVFHGYGFGENREETRQRLEKAATPINGPHVSRVKDLARTRNMAVVLGFAERSPNGLFHNSAAIISASGDVLDVYRKVHCRTFEHSGHSGVFTPGDRFVSPNITLESMSFRLGTMICFDREIPESARCLRAMGAQLIACPLACDTEPLAEHTDYAHNEMITRCRAAENEVFIAVVNHSGRSNGGSFVVGPGGEAVVQLGAGPEVRTVEIPVTAVRDELHSNAFGWMGWGYRRQDVYDRHRDPDRAV
ncbi:MAG: carbon-nitrogen hydrolase family protein [Lentisphaerae bacterium]|nr:carbon-nitrogen hydrolase family protein [Lentisphaerota bacterium]